MRRLMEELNLGAFASSHPAIQAAFAHYSFVWIHSFQCPWIPNLPETHSRPRDRVAGAIQPNKPSARYDPTDRREIVQFHRQRIRAAVHPRVTMAMSTMSGHRSDRTDMLVNASSTRAISAHDGPHVTRSTKVIGLTPGHLRIRAAVFAEILFFSGVSPDRSSNTRLGVTWGTRLFADFF
jgi:hypothetical protein